MLSDVVGGVNRGDGWENPFNKEAKVLWVGTVPLFKHDDDSGEAGNDLELHGSPTGVYVKATRKPVKSAKSAPRRNATAGVS